MSSILGVIWKPQTPLPESRSHSFRSYGEAQCASLEFFQGDGYAFFAPASAVAQEAGVLTLVCGEPLFTKDSPYDFRKARGSFAALQRNSTGEWIFLRAPLGQCQLFYTDAVDGVVYFSDSLPLLAHLPGLSRELSHEAICRYFALGYIPAPWTIYQDIHKLPAGYSLHLPPARDPSLNMDWTPPCTIADTLSWDDAVEETRRLLLEAIQDRLDLHPHTDFMLSGGIDSGTLLGLTQKFFPDSTRRAITVAFSEKEYDESSMTAQTARRNGIPLEVIRATPGDLPILEARIADSGEPFADSSLLPSAIAMRHAEGRVLMTGDGGDEVFGGYRRYQAMLLRCRVPGPLEPLLQPLARFAETLLPAPRENRTRIGNLTRALHVFAQAPLPAYAAFQQVTPAPLLKRLLRSAPETDFLEEWRHDLAALGLEINAFGCNLLDLMHYLPDDGCRKQSLAAAGAGVTLLSPLLDRRLLDFAIALPQHFRFTPREGKRLLRAVGAEFLPDGVLRHAKRGFGVPLSEWFRGPLSAEIRRMSDGLSAWDSHGLFQPGVLREVTEAHLSGKANHASLLWAVYCLRLWEMQNPA